METNLGRRWHFAAGGRFFGPQLGDGVGQRSQRQRQLTAPDVARETADETQVGPHLTVAEDADAGRGNGGSAPGGPAARPPQGTRTPSGEPAAPPPAAASPSMRTDSRPIISPPAIVFTGRSSPSPSHVSPSVDHSSHWKIERISSGWSHLDSRLFNALSCFPVLIYH